MLEALSWKQHPQSRGDMGVFKVVKCMTESDLTLDWNMPVMDRLHIKMCKTKFRLISLKLS